MTPVASVGNEAYAKTLTAGMLQLNGMSGVAMGAKAAESSGGFPQLLAQAIDQTVKLQSAAEQKTVDFVTGETDDLHSVMIAQEKAGLAFQLTMQVRNKMVDAYQEVMRMQI